jgi:hypothetical protein
MSYAVTSDPKGLSSEVTKRYFWTNTLNNTFPPEFIASKNRKYIVVYQCKATLSDVLVGDVIMHADFIMMDHYMDHACCFVNEEPNRDTAKYEYPFTKSTFRIWFTDLDGNEVHPESFALRMLLIY